MFWLYTQRPKGALKTLKSERKNEPTLWVSRDSGSFCYVQVLSALKAKRLTRIQYFQAPGIPMRGRSQPAGGSKVQTKTLNDIFIGKKITIFSSLFI